MSLTIIAAFCTGMSLGATLTWLANGKRGPAMWTAAGTVIAGIPLIARLISGI